MAWYLLPLSFLLIGCSLQKMAMRSATPLFEQSAQGVMKESNWDFFKASSPGNLKFMELLWEQDQDNLPLLTVLIKSYAGYAFAVSETLALEDELKGLEESKNREEAISFYTRSLDFGIRYLKEKDISSKDLLSHDETALVKKLKELDEDDVTALLYTAQSWGSLINLQKDNIALVSQVPKVKLLFDRVCEIKPDIDHNVCEIFFAQYESARPKMLGGNPQKGEKLFQEAMAKNPQNLLIRLSYIQYVLVPMMDEERYEKEATFLREEFLKWRDLNRDSLENVSPYKNAQELNLYNAVAHKRFNIIEKYKKTIF